MMEDSKWAPLAKISDSPEKWLKVYAHYQELLLNEDVAAFWNEQFQMQCKLREDAEAKNIELLKELREQWLPDAESDDVKTILRLLIIRVQEGKANFDKLKFGGA
jgi:hypothetical protein